MPCPNCKQVSHCSCKSCLPRRKPNETLEVWIDKEIGVIACGHCGFAMLSAAWAAMDHDLYLEPKIPLKEAIEKYRKQGKLPGEPNYKPSIFAHWRIKLWRWRGIIGHILELIKGNGVIYKETRWKTIRHHIEKL